MKRHFQNLRTWRLNPVTGLKEVKVRLVESPRPYWRQIDKLAYRGPSEDSLRKLSVAYQERMDMRVLEAITSKQVSYG